MMPANENAQPEVSAEVPVAFAAAVNLWLTQWRYEHGYLSFDGCKAAFKAHPEWLTQ